MINSKNKGSSFERHIVNYLKDQLGDQTIARNLDQVRDGGSDIELKEYSIECKHQKIWSVHKWWKQVTNNCKRKKPVLIMKKNYGEPLVMIRLDDFVELIREEISE